MKKSLPVGLQVENTLLFAKRQLLASGIEAEIEYNLKQKS